MKSQYFFGQDIKVDGVKGEGVKGEGVKQEGAHETVDENKEQSLSSCWTVQSKSQGFRQAKSPLP